MDVSICVFVIIDLMLCVKCTFACSSGWYGDGCVLECPSNCRGNVCDVTQGTCSNCTDGWTGNYCDQPCSLGTFGKDCGQVCKGHCKDGCNHVTGKCDKGCEDGWYTENCNIGCPRGSYGAGCKYRCGRCRDGVGCHHVTGYCVSGCEPGYTGQACNNVCPYGHYGEKCEKFCGADSRCNPVTGECCGCTELLKLVEERGGNLDHKSEVVIGLAVPLGVSLVVNCTLCLATCYYYIIYKEEIGKRKGENFLN
ncbi:scavenger receptor class F member 2-like [Ostrea edulis]|uniref:scavenger receptor class F member 2-like n=1 Tax=Ostrea edulis TaxID=37623 RepID=UPI0024AF3C0D|nr:scavenger receptor class F member 2-like [Ostrea edulis]